MSYGALADALHMAALGCPVEVEVDPLRWELVMPWEVGRLHMLLASHPDRRIYLPTWAAPDFKVIAGRAWPVPIMPPKGADRAYTHDSAPVWGGATCEQVVEALARAGCNPVPRGAFKWRALCPVCRMRGKRDRRVYVERDFQQGRDRISSFCLCDTADILAVLGLFQRRRPRYILDGKVDLDSVFGEGGRAA